MRQRLLAELSGSEGELICYDGKREVYRFPCFCGANGVIARKREGDGCTPQGCFDIDYVFGTLESAETEMPYRRITEKSVWVDDAESVLYNRWTEGGSAKGERLADYPAQYALAAVIEYNTCPVIKGAGSAIFLHCGDKPTSGCIAVLREAMETIAAWLRPEASPQIQILPKQ